MDVNLKSSVHFQDAVKKVLWEISNILFCFVLKLVYSIMSSKNHFRRVFLF